MKRAKTFNPAEQDRLLPLIVEGAREASSIGAMERLAGIPQDQASRAEFWKPYMALEKERGVQGCFDAAMAECRRRIAASIAWVVLS